MKVLIVDADWRFTRQAADFLESHAHNVVLQPGARDAVDQIAHWQPDLVIISAELFEDALVDSLYSRLQRPAVLLTAYMDRYDRAWQAWQKGGDELLIKPILTLEDLHQSIVTARENAVTGERSRQVAGRASA